MSFMVAELPSQPFVFWAGEAYAVSLPTGDVESGAFSAGRAASPRTFGAFEKRSAMFGEKGDDLVVCIYAWCSVANVRLAKGCVGDFRHQLLGAVFFFSILGEDSTDCAYAAVAVFPLDDQRDAHGDRFGLIGARVQKQSSSTAVASLRASRPAQQTPADYLSSVVVVPYNCTAGRCDGRTSRMLLALVFSI